jgi:hypothetical protein
MQDKRLPLHMILIPSKYTKNEQYYQIIFAKRQDIF